MARKQTAWKTKGMNRDLSVSAFNPEFAFENMNLRLATNEGNTTMSWVNERGTLLMNLSINIHPWKTVTGEGDYVSEIEGYPIGTAILNHQLVLFTTLNTEDNKEPYIAHYKSLDNPNDTTPEKYDCIYVLNFSSGQWMSGKLLYKGNLNFSTLYPLETLVSYEAEHVQKVYWTDARNQPRLINIADIDHFRRWNHVGSNDAPDYAIKTDTYFDFVPTVEMSGTSITVERSTGGGLFAPGVIQYCFAYINKYGQESNIVSVSPLYYLSFEDRGASPEEKVTCSFHISVSNLDANFDAVRIYSIQRTSLNLEPIVRQFKDLKIEDTVGVQYTDNGTEGVSMDPTELLYIGGKEISALTMTEKDQTLFIGNFTQKDASMAELQRYFDLLRGAVSVTFQHRADVKFYKPSSGKGLYSYESQLGKSQEEISTFKGGEWYRFGFQLQKRTGEWTEPIFLKDVQNKLYPANGMLPFAECTLVSSHFDNTKYKRIRPVVVYPNIVQRSVLCQGVLNPTVVNVHDAGNHAPDAQASWYFRPYMLEGGIENPEVESTTIRNASGYIKGSYVVYEHNQSLPVIGDPNQKRHNRMVEIQNATDYNAEDERSNSHFKVSQTIVTLNSPDIEFDTDVQNYTPNDFKLRIIGTIPITSNTSSHSIMTSSPMVELGHNVTELEDGKEYTRQNGEEEVLTLKKAFGRGQLDKKVYYTINFSGEKAGNRLVAEYLWNDSKVTYCPGVESDSIESWIAFYNYMIYPWHKNGSLNTDKRPEGEASSVLKTKKESNILFSKDSIYQPDNPKGLIGNVGVQLHLTENDHLYNIRVKSGDSSINYYPNIDKVLYNSTEQTLLMLEDPVNYLTVNKWSLKDIDNAIGTATNLRNRVKAAGTISNSVVSMKYKSTSHAVIGCGNNRLDRYGSSRRVVSEPDNNYLLLGELYKEQDESPFTDAMYQQWNIGGKAIDLPNETGDIHLEWTIGDTYYQRYDCLKTYAFTNDDPNQIIEILSFMCETHVNIDGRYDRNRGQIDNTNMRPQIFNLLNPVYSQQDNFFNYQKLGIDVRDKTAYPNQITYSKTKISGADVDMWTNVTLASALELDGDKGSLNKLTRLNDQIIAFQDTGISQILYNENAAISTQQGVPIELANSGKVQGKRYLSDTIGCSNKWSIVSTPSGIYFMDSIGKNIFIFNGQLTNLSTSLGFNSWSKNNIVSGDIKWSPYMFSNFTSCYDKKNQEVMFINKDIALAFSEKLNAFTSFYDYGYTPYFCNLDDAGIWIRNPYEYKVIPEIGDPPVKGDPISRSKPCQIWKHHAGEYCRFFDINKPYWMTLIGNPEPLTDKIFTNLEFRACVEGDGNFIKETKNDVETIKFGEFHLPFDYLETWNEYQFGTAILQNKHGHDWFKHHLNDHTATLKRKFRIWRCDIPRDNRLQVRTGVFDYTFDKTFRGGLKTAHPLDRMRNPWLYLTLTKQAAEDVPSLDDNGKIEKDKENVVVMKPVTLPKTEIHDLVMTYFN